MANHIERLHSVLPYGVAFPGGAVGLAAVRFAGCCKAVEGFRRIALLVVRKVEHVSKCSCVLFFGEDSCIILARG